MKTQVLLTIGGALLVLLATAQVAEKPTFYHPPRLSDRHVDMQGMWRNSNLTPLERPPEFTQLAISEGDAKQLKEQYSNPRCCCARY